MVKIIINFFTKYFLINIYLVFIRNNFHKNLIEYNFQNIEFNDIDQLKKIFYFKNYYNSKSNIKNNYEFHSFDWLNAGKKIGGSKNINIAKNHIILWSKSNYIKNSFIWNGFFISRRINNLIYNYDYYGSTASKDDKKIIQNLLIKHYVLLKIEIELSEPKSVTLEEAKAVLLLSSIYNKKNTKYILLLKEIILSQIDSNGFHKSYNPTKQAEFINDLYEIKNILLFFKNNIPNELDFQILNMTSLLINLLHVDGSLALYNGSNNYYLNNIIRIIKNEKDLKPKKIKNITQGIISYADKEKKIFMDIVNPINKPINYNFHSSTLAFEFSCINEKIITNCGSLNKKYGKGPEYLRYSAAHSTIIINNTNISELVEKKSYKRAPQNITIKTSDQEDKIIWETSHDGYLKNFKKIIKRRLIIDKKINKISGNDEIICAKINSKKDNYSIRFHLMPGCSALITNDKKTILLKTKLGQSWIFSSESKLLLEESIYIGGGKRVEQNKQIVIYGSILNTKKIEKWSLTKK